MKLNDDDGRAVDAVLGGESDGAAHLQTRLQHVEKLVTLLSMMPGDDPPSDLVERTLHHVYGDDASFGSAPSA